jgi:hypothetical protein
MNYSGIDKIKLILNPVFLNPKMPKHIRSDNALTLHPAGMYTFLAIHAEYCNPMIDYRITISQAIYELMEKEVVLFPHDNCFFTYCFIINNLGYFVFGVSQIEFFFDFPQGKVSANQEAIENGDIKQHKDTIYSNDNNSRNNICVYNRRNKLLHDRHISREKIDMMGVEYRIEARLSRENCPYLDLANLSGNYEDIFKRFLPFLAVLFYNHLYSHVEVKGKANTYWTRLVRNAKKGKTRYIDRGKLKKSEPVQEIPKNGTVRRQIQRQLLGNYYEHVENANIPIEMGEDSDGKAQMANS